MVTYVASSKRKVVRARDQRVETLPSSPILKIFTEAYPMQQELHSLYVLDQSSRSPLGFSGRLGRRGILSFYLSRRNRPINKLSVTMIRRYCATMPFRVSDEISGDRDSATSHICNSSHVSLRLLGGWVEAQCEDQPNDAKQKIIRRSFTRRFLCVMQSLRPDREASSLFVNGRDRHTPYGNRNVNITSVPLHVVTTIFSQISESI